MQTTFGQAKKILARYASAYDLADIGAAVNAAIDELSAAQTWSELRKVKRFSVVGEYFPIPQDCDSVIRACVGGKPSRLWGLDYEFLNSGPGSLDTVPPGYAPVNGLQDLGYFPCMYDITDADGLRLCAFGTADMSGEALRVKGKLATGDSESADVPYTVWAGDISLIDASTVSATSQTFAEIDRMTVPEGASCYISLYGIDTDNVFHFLSRMHPGEKVPRFRRYRLPGFDTTEGTSYDVLAEVRLRPVRLVDDDEPVPFDSLLPVQYMLQSMRDMAAGEIDSADKYRARAVGALMTREATQSQRQGLVVINAGYDGSPGEVSANFINI